VAHLQGNLSLQEAIAATILASRQYAKRQRTWFRTRMANWAAITPA
jgi:tRNA dimethylallyltransferase